MEPASPDLSPVRKIDSNPEIQSLHHQSDQSAAQGLSKDEIKQLFSGAPHFILESGRHGRYFPQILFPWNSDLDIADLKDRRFLRHESFGLATLHAHLPIPDELTYRIGGDATPPDHEKWVRPPFDAGVFEVPNMLGCEGKEVGTVGMRHFLELPVADATRPKAEETYGGPQMPKSQLTTVPATECFQHLSHGQGYATIGKHAPRVDRLKIIRGGPKAWKRVGVREFTTKAVVDRLQRISQVHESLVSKGLKANVLDADSYKNLYRNLFTEFLYAPAKIIDHEDPYSLKVQIEALVKVLTTPGLWLDFSVVKWRNRLGQILFEKGLHEGIFDNHQQLDPDAERRALLFQILLSIELLIRLDAAIRIGMVDTTREKIVTVHEIHHFGRLRNTKVDWDLVLARRFLDHVHVSLAEGTANRLEPPGSSGGLISKLKNRLSVKEIEQPTTARDCILTPRRGHVQLEGLIRFARAIDWPSFHSFEDSVKTRFEAPTGLSTLAESPYATALHNPPKTPQSRRNSLLGTPKRGSRNTFQLQPGDEAQSGGWLSRTWLTGLVMPGETITHLLMATVLENDANTLSKLGPTALLNGGFVLEGRSWWSKSCIMSRVLGACEGSVECMGWVGCKISPQKHTGEICDNGWIEVNTQPAPKLRETVRIGDGPQMSKQSSVLGSGDGQILASEFAMPLDNALDALGHVQVKFEAMKMPLNGNADGGNHGKHGSDRFLASMNFTTTTTSGTQALHLQLKHDVHFITAQPCRPPHGHVASPTEIYSDHHLGRGHHLPAHPLHITYTYELKTAADLVTDRWPEPPNPCALEEYHGPWIIDVRGSREKSLLARAWCAHVGRHAIVARVGKVCLGCCVREARALEVGIIIRIGGEEAVERPAV